MKSEVADLIRQLSDFNGDAPGKRLILDNPSEEMLALVEAINAVLDRNEASHAELQRFASDAAHQLRTPLAVLTARVSGSDGILDRNDIRHDIEWMSRLISQLLSKARAARSEFEVDSRIDLSALALDVVASLAPLAIHRGRQLELSGADYPVPAYGNSELAFEAVSNLVENAIAHSPLNSVVVVHVTQNREIEVIDQGRGVPPDDVERIFSRFSQGRRPTDGGAGLGLSIVSDIMKKHNGAVSYVEREGVGAVFRLSFQ